MRALKAFLAIMAIFIVGGFGFLGYEIYKRATDPERQAEAGAPPAPTAPGKIAETALELGAGARISSVVLAGSRVLFTVQLPDGQGDRLYILDPRNGAVTASVTTGSATAPNSERNMPSRRPLNNDGHHTLSATPDLSPVNFTSDNVSGAAPEILEALIAASASGPTPSYGADPLTARVTEKISALFEREAVVFPVATGSAANALALATLAPPYGAIYCHEMAHVNTDECGAPEMFTGGAKLVGLPGAGGKLTPGLLRTTLEKAGVGVVHSVQPAAVTLTQATEAGTVYTPDEIAALAEVARSFNLPVHMDGARFANALVRLGCSPAELTWKAGVDVLSFGATKNGALAAEAVVFFRPELAESFAFRRKRAGHLFSKMRFLSAQLDAYLTDDLWLRLARHANAMADRLAAGLTAVPGARLRDPVEANEIFIDLPEPVIAGLEQRGYAFYRWDGTVVRLVTAWNTDAGDVDRMIADARELGAVTG